MPDPNLRRLRGIINSPGRAMGMAHGWLARYFIPHGVNIVESSEPEKAFQFLLDLMRALKVPPHRILGIPLATNRRDSAYTPMVSYLTGKYAKLSKTQGIKEFNALKAVPMWTLYAKQIKQERLKHVPDRKMLTRYPVAMWLINDLKPLLKQPFKSDNTQADNWFEQTSFYDRVYRNLMHLSDAGRMLRISIFSVVQKPGEDEVPQTLVGVARCRALPGYWKFERVRRTAIWRIHIYTSSGRKMIFYVKKVNNGWCIIRWNCGKPPRTSGKTSPRPRR